MNRDKTITNSTPNSLTTYPIGFIKSSMKLKFDAPHQPQRNSNEISVIELLPRMQFEQAIQDLSGFEYIWLIWWFNRNNNWKPKVLPPRGKGIKRGLFATRSPHRPNPIGLTAVKLIKIEKRKIYVGSHDLVDGTPILDIKPYLKSSDAFPNAKQGWVDEIEAQLVNTQYSIITSSQAQKQLNWLEKRDINFINRAKEILLQDPLPHRTRRITKVATATYRIACGAWRVFYKLEESEIRIEYITPGYPMRALLDKKYTNIYDRSAQIEFYQKWPLPK
jgi:tRNA (adenine37-N6)-methyltransferase